MLEISIIVHLKARIIVSNDLLKLRASTINLKIIEIVYNDLYGPVRQKPHTPLSEVTNISKVKWI